MTDFAQAFYKGIEVAKSAERIKKEVNDVFSELNTQIQEATGGRIIITVGGSKYGEKGDDAIYAVSRFEHMNRVILAIWSQDPAGYPCKISWASKTFWCEDREALERTLAEMLQDPVVGEKLYSFLKQKNQPDNQEISPVGPVQDTLSNQHPSQ